jgi:hypothetical protein
VEWSAASDRLAGRGLLDRSGAPTADGRDLRSDIERRTDELASAPLVAVGQERVEKLLALLTPAAERIARSGEIFFPNPMGLPPPES